MGVTGRVISTSPNSCTVDLMCSWTERKKKRTFLPREDMAHPASAPAAPAAELAMVAWPLPLAAGGAKAPRAAGSSF